MPERRRTKERNERLGRRAAEHEFGSDDVSPPDRKRPPADMEEGREAESQQDAAQGEALRSDAGGGPSVRRNSHQGRERSPGGDTGGDGQRADDRAAEREPPGERPGGHLSAGEAARAGLRGLGEVIGKQPVGVTAVSPRQDGWLVGVEVVELERVPSSADILALYEAELDMDGTLRSYRRTKRYARGRGDGGEG